MTSVVDCLSVGRFCLTQGLCPSETGEPIHDIRNPDNFEKHRIKDLGIVTYSHIWAWVLEDVVKYDQEIPYIKKRGAMVWVKLLCQRQMYEQDVAVQNPNALDAAKGRGGCEPVNALRKLGAKSAGRRYSRSRQRCRVQNPTGDNRGVSPQESPQQSYEESRKPERPCQGLQAQCSCGRHLFQFAKIPEKVSEYEGGPPRWPRSYCKACGKQTRYNLLQCTSCSRLLRDCVLQ